MSRTLLVNLSEVSEVTYSAVAGNERMTCQMLGYRGLNVYDVPSFTDATGELRESVVASGLVNWEFSEPRVGREFKTPEKTLLPPIVGDHSDEIYKIISRTNGYAEFHKNYPGSGLIFYTPQFFKSGKDKRYYTRIKARIANNAEAHFKFGTVLSLSLNGEVELYSEESGILTASVKMKGTGHVRVSQAILQTARAGLLDRLKKVTYA